MKIHDPPVFVSGNARREYNEVDRTRTALGASIHWFPAYNDGVKGDFAKQMGIGFGEVTGADQRGGEGRATWAANDRLRWDAKYCAPPAYGSNPLSQIETKDGLTFDQRNQRDKLLREKENAGNASPPKAGQNPLAKMKWQAAKEAVTEKEPADTPPKLQNVLGQVEARHQRYFENLTGRLGPPFNAPTTPNPKLAAAIAQSQARRQVGHDQAAPGAV